MFSRNSNLQAVIGDFRIDDMMRYSQFVPRLDNLCQSLNPDQINLEDAIQEMEKAREIKIGV